jgi:hypothetical protein
LKKLKYQGFTGAGVCECNYAVGDDGGKKLVVVQQGALTSTSITNRIEHIASLLLAGDLAGIESKQVRFFEHYPAHLQPLVEWQEVEFEIHAKRPDTRPWWKRLWSALVGGFSPSWAVDKPEWTRLDAGTVPKNVLALVS